MKTRTFLMLAVGVVLASPATAQQGPTKLRVAYDGFSMTSGPLIYADKQGIFKKFGLDIAPIFVDGGSMLTQAVVGGSVDIAQNGYTPGRRRTWTWRSIWRNTPRCRCRLPA